MRGVDELGGPHRFENDLDLSERFTGLS